MRFGRKKERLTWLIEEHDDGWYVQNGPRAGGVTPSGPGQYDAVFGPYETEEEAGRRAVINRVILPTHKSLQLLKQPGEYERRMLGLMTREQREGVMLTLRSGGLKGGDEWAAGLVAKSIEGGARRHGSLHAGARHIQGALPNQQAARQARGSGSV